MITSMAPLSRETLRQENPRSGPWVGVERWGAVVAELAVITNLAWK
jgi:hypothetical protein